MHDDQHGTAIISGAGLLNALDIQGKKIEEAKLVVNGAGAAASSCTKLYMGLGIKKENIVMVDSKEVISTSRTSSPAAIRHRTNRYKDLSRCHARSGYFSGTFRGRCLDNRNGTIHE